MKAASAKCMTKNTSEAKNALLRDIEQIQAQRRSTAGMLRRRYTYSGVARTTSTNTIVWTSQAKEAHNILMRMGHAEITCT